MQHPFIANATDPKPILDLLAEFKAEIIDEEIADLNDDKLEQVIKKTFFSIMMILNVLCDDHKAKPTSRMTTVRASLTSSIFSLFSLCLSRPLFSCYCLLEAKKRARPGPRGRAGNNAAASTSSASKKETRKKGLIASVHSGK